MAKVTLDDAAIDRLLDSPDGPVGQLISQIGDKVAAAAVRNYRGHGGGRVYKRGGVEQQASLPGESPDVFTGDLAGSVVKTMEGTSAVVANTSEHAAYVEFGTGKMAARPALRPALYNTVYGASE